jgi:hypothetical protein
MRRLSARHLEAEVRQEAASLALCVWGQLGQVTEKAPGVVFVVMRDAVDGGHPEVGVAGLVAGNRLEVHVHFSFVGFHPEAW